MNYLHRGLIVGIACTTMTPTSWAGTVIERRDTQGNTQKIFLDENKARIDSSDPNHYTLMNLQDKKAYMVDSKEKRMVTLDLMGSPPPLPPNMPKPPAQPPVKAELVKQGEGPKIAGYPTVIYQVLANGKECSENYLSPEAAKVAYIQDFITAIYKMSDSRKSKGMPEHPCQQAHDDLEGKSMELGVPMKSVVKGSPKGEKGGPKGEKDGPKGEKDDPKREKVRHEILSIKTDVKVPDDTFTLPKDYKVISEQEMIKMMQEDMKRQWEEERQRGDRGPPSNRPDMQEDMRQRGEEGRQRGRDRRDDRGTAPEQSDERQRGRDRRDDRGVAPEQSDERQRGRDRRDDRGVAPEQSDERQRGRDYRDDRGTAPEQSDERKPGKDRRDDRGAAPEQSDERKPGKDRRDDREPAAGTK